MQNKPVITTNFLKPKLIMRRNVRNSMYQTKQFEKDLLALGITLNDKQISQFIQYFELLTEWNSFMNLTAIKGYDEVLKKHFVDSLTLIKAIDLSGDLSLIDVGTGAGFPGIPIKIVFPNIRVTLIDSLNKRINFLNEVIKRLELVDIEAIHGRAEDVAKPNYLREKFDICVSRAVANLSTLSEYCLPFVKVDGVFIPYKSEKSEFEIQEAEKAIHVLGGNIDNQIELFLPETDIYRKLIIIKKVKRTPEKYPRKAGLPSKEPLH